MRQILHLKAKIILRVFKEMPVYGHIILTAIACLLLWAVYKTSDTAPYNYVISGVYFLILAMINTSRRDFRLCQKLILHPYRLFVVEYFILSLPFITAALCNSAYKTALIYSIIPFVAAAVPQISIRIRQRTIPILIKMPSLESVSFFRRYRIIIWLFTASALLLCCVTGISVVIVYFLILFYAGSSFSRSESLPVLCLEELPPPKFLHKKITGELILWAKLTLPIFFLYILFNIKTAYYILVPLILGPVAICCSVFIKYAHYSPKGDANTGSIFTAICMMGFILPPLLPFSLIMILKYRNNAIDNLSQYLDAYNQ